MTVTVTSPNAGVTRILNDPGVRAPESPSTINTARAITDSVLTRATADSVSVAAASQSEDLNLRAAALNVAIVGTQLDVLDTGSAEVSRILGQLQNLASRASLGGLSESAIEVIDGQFQALRIVINNVPPRARVGLGALDTAETLATTTPANGENNAVELGGFTDTQFFGPRGEANLRTPEAANNVLQQVDSALSQVDSQRGVIQGLQQRTERAQATVESGLENLAASRSGAPQDDAATLLSQLSKAGPDLLALQTARLPANVVQLLGE